MQIEIDEETYEALLRIAKHYENIKKKKIPVVKVLKNIVFDFTRKLIDVNEPFFEVLER